jgi:cytochrome c-type biogenesis protein CcmH/NrfF
MNPAAESAEKDLLCPCNCSHRTLFECDCGMAAELRGQIDDMLKGRDLSTPALQKQAYDQILAKYIHEYGGEQVLANPRSSFPWLLPMLGALGGLGLIVVVGRRWVHRGFAKPVATTHPTAADDDYADKLDDELRDVD